MQRPKYDEVMNNFMAANLNIYLKVQNPRNKNIMKRNQEQEWLKY